MLWLNKSVSFAMEELWATFFLSFCLFSSISAPSSKYFLPKLAWNGSSCEWCCCCWNCYTYFQWQQLWKCTEEFETEEETAVESVNHVATGNLPLSLSISTYAEDQQTRSTLHEQAKHEPKKKNIQLPPPPSSSQTATISGGQDVSSIRKGAEVA